MEDLKKQCGAPDTQEAPEAGNEELSKDQLEEISGGTPSGKTPVVYLRYTMTDVMVNSVETSSGSSGSSGSTTP